MSAEAPAPPVSQPERQRVIDEIRGAEKFILVTHENPDGDALGSLVGMQRVLTTLGKDSVMFMDADEFPLPYEYRFFQLEGLVSSPPADLNERTVVFLDCGNIDRNPADIVKRDDAHILNIDHHHDNTRFGTVNLVVSEASCTAEIVWDLMRALGVAPTPDIADALYVGLVTDTGKFMYENTGTRAHVMAAELIAAGVDVNAIYRRLYEEMPFAKLALLGRGLANIQRFDERRPHLHASHEGRLRSGRRGGELLGGRHRPSAVRAGHPRRRGRSRCALRRQRSARPQEGVAAVHGRRRRRVGDRTGRRGRRPPAGSRLHDDDGRRAARGLPAPAGRSTARRLSRRGRGHPLRQACGRHQP